MTPTFPIAPLNRMILVAAGAMVVAVVLVGSFLYPVHAEPLVAKADNSVKAYSGPIAAPAPTHAPTLGVNIANNGLTTLRDATVVSVSGTTILVSMPFSGGNLNWSITTDGNTTFPTASAADQTIAGIKPGDLVTVTGMLSGGGSTPSITAEFVRE